MIVEKLGIKDDKRYFCGSTGKRPYGQNKKQISGRFWLAILGFLKTRSKNYQGFTKGSRRNNFAELALRFGSGLADPKE